LARKVKHLMEHYRDAYSPFFLADSADQHEFLSDCLAMNLVAQSNTYVTYEVDWIFFGEGNEAAKEWVTFVLADGHRLKEIISNKNMLWFYKTPRTEGRGHYITPLIPLNIYSSTGSSLPSASTTDFRSSKSS